MFFFVPGMTLDGFDPRDAQAFGGYSPDTSEHFYGWVQRLARWLHVEVDGIENLPAGRALLVANHAFGWDVAFAVAAIRARTGRNVFVLGEHLFWRVPLIRQLACKVGTVDGTRENVDELLSADQLVLVLPGGMREAVKPGALRYRLLWGHRHGFVRAAIHNQAPIVPVAALGADDLFDFVGDAIARGHRFLDPIGLSGVPLPRPRHLLPHHLHVRPRKPLRYVIGEPIAPPFPASSEDDPQALRTLRWMSEGALHELIDLELARRAHVSMGRGDDAPHA